VVVDPVAVVVCGDVTPFPGCTTVARMSGVPPVVCSLPAAPVFTFFFVGYYLVRVSWIVFL